MILTTASNLENKYNKIISKKDEEEMMISHLKMGAGPNPETPCISSILQIVNVQHSCGIMNYHHNP
jgi:hypothetical protein